MTTKLSPETDGDPLLAYRDQEFLDSDDARPLRIVAEYLAPMRAFREQQVRDTIVFFGSARIRPDGPLGRYYTEARALARAITEWSMAVDGPAHRRIVCSGGGPGIMEAANRGARDAGGRTIGLNIGLPREQRPNPYITPGLSFEFHYFFMRKLWFAQIAKALIVFPGGFGTMDELWEMMTLSQTGKMPKNTLILIYGRKYWNDVLNLKGMVRWGTINQNEYDLLQYADTVDEAFEVIRSGLEKYHMEVDPFLQAY